MESIALHPSEPSSLPPLSSATLGWEHLRVEQCQYPPGEATCGEEEDHTIYLSLASRPIRLLQIQAGKTYSGLYSKGDFSITPAKTPIFARWEGVDHYLQIRIADRFVQRVAQESLSMNVDRLEFLSEFRVRDPHLESIAMLLLAELKPDHLGGKLYIESLANVLAVHLLRHYAATKPRLPVYEGGLPERHLLQVLDYIHDHLDQEIKLADLAALLNMSQFH
ncbi:MAG TPA: hypothetical protein V6C65_42205, partial [Allocoleopsis sp.]